MPTSLPSRGRRRRVVFLRSSARTTCSSWAMAMACLGLLTPGRRWRAWPVIPPRSDLHPGDIGNFPGTPATGDAGGPGRRDVRGTGRTWAWHGLVRTGARGIRYPIPRAGGRALRPARGAVGHLTGLGETPLASGSLLRVGTTPCSTRLRCPSRCRPGADGDRGERAGVTPQSSPYAIRPTDYDTPFVSVQESARLFENVHVVAGAAGRDRSTLARKCPVGTG
jgi:hypothetical protein